MAKIITADVLEWCKTYDGPKFHAILCDPPYELGFMGKNWDKTGIVFDPATWEALAEHLYPGGFGMAFASSRGWHRLAVAIEDAGLRIHPSIFGWNFGSGFPKATRVKGSEVFEGHRYGLQAMKPALEPIIIFQKNYEGKPVESIVETGAGALNIDGARIGTEEREYNLKGGENLNKLSRKDGHDSESAKGCGAYGIGAKQTSIGSKTVQGRWPANFYVDEEAAARLGEQSGERKSSIYDTSKGDTCGFHDSLGRKKLRKRTDVGGYDDTGTAARFFFNVNRQIDESDPVLYQAKTSRKERDAGLDDMASIRENLTDKEREYVMVELRKHGFLE